LLSRCLKCHVYDPSGARMAPVRVAEPVMPRSIFNHAPHVQQASCETCHASTAKSKLATDVNVFGVEGCRTCHNPSQAKSDCETCHVYHPSSPAKLLAVTQ
jgi:cytochrome c7-like protein